MKKIPFVFAVALLILSGCAKSDDPTENTLSGHQLKSEATRTVNSYFNPDPVDSYFPLECGGELVDWLEPYNGSIECHMKIHYTDGKMSWIQINAKGTARSNFTGEIFKINELNKITFDEDENLTDFRVHTHASGDKGNNIIIFTRIIDFYNFVFEIEKAICTDY